MGPLVLSVGLLEEVVHILEEVVVHQPEPGEEEEASRLVVEEVHQEEAASRLVVVEDPVEGVELRVRDRVICPSLCDPFYPCDDVALQVLA
jgi:hypothetical protein